MLMMRSIVGGVGIRLVLDRHCSFVMAAGVAAVWDTADKK
jgi:hypothetical protein